MKTVLLKSIFLNNRLLKIICLLFGYSFWYIASFNTICTIQINIPLYFTTQLNKYCASAPETISVTLKGKRCDMYSLEIENLAAHINIDNFQAGKHAITIDEQNFFLPKTISLVRYKPSNLYITINP